jgi:hypothetical protein
VAEVGARARLWDRLRTGGGILLMALAVFTAAASYEANTRLAAVTACQADANREFSSALALRVQANKDSNAAQRSFLAAVSDPTSTPEARRGAYGTYLQALDASDASLAEHPLTVRDCSQAGG